MKNLFKIGLRIIPVLTVLLLFYIGYLNFYGDRSQNAWFGYRYSKLDIAKASAQAQTFFEKYFDSLLYYNPEYGCMLGLKKSNLVWNDLSENQLKKKLNWQKNSLAYLRDSLDYEQLNHSTQISFTLLKQQLENNVLFYPYRQFRYSVSWICEKANTLPLFFINTQQINNLNEAEDYLTRLQLVPQKFEGLMEQLKRAEQAGAIPPKFLFSKFIRSAEAVLEGWPIQQARLNKHIILKDFEDKINLLKNLNSNTKDSLINRCKNLLNTTFKESYQNLIHHLRQLSQKANNNIGLWRLNNGTAYYRLCLKTQTSTNLAPNEIYDLGQEEIERIHEEVKLIMKKLNFEGDLQSFFTHLQNNPDFYYSNSIKDKATYSTQIQTIIDSVQQQLTIFFHKVSNTKPNIQFLASDSEYNITNILPSFPAYQKLDLNNYYVNTNDIMTVPKYAIKALTYNAIAPGYQMQSAFMKELKGLPKFRYYNYNTYTNGWGLYAADLAKEMGLYEDLYADLGRLMLELWASCFLVVDVGIHNKRWSPKQAIQFYKINCPKSQLACEEMVTFHITKPAQATSYKIGMISLLELRAKAKQTLKEKFDIRKFHEVILENGALPLNILEDLVDQYIQNN